MSFLRSANAGAAEDSKAPSAGAKSLCIPFDQARFGTIAEGTKCVGCGDVAKRWTMFGRSEPCFFRHSGNPLYWVTRICCDEAHTLYFVAQVTKRQCLLERASVSSRCSLSAGLPAAVCGGFSCTSSSLRVLCMQTCFILDRDRLAQGWSKTACPEVHSSFSPQHAMLYNPYRLPATRSLLPPQQFAPSPAIIYSSSTLMFTSG